MLVLPPDFDEGEVPDYMVLGMQFWLADKFTEIGLEGASALMHSLGYGARELVRAPPLDDEQVHQVLSSHQAQFGLLTSFRVTRARPRLATARLVQLRRDPPLVWLGRWEFDGGTDHLPTAVHDLFRLAAEKLGYVLGPTTWEHVFGTSDISIADGYLHALGCYSACDQGIAVPPSEPAIEHELAAIAAGVTPAIGLFPLLVLAMRSTGSAPDDQLCSAVRRAVDVVGEPPEAWATMLRELAIADAPLAN